MTENIVAGNKSLLLQEALSLFDQGILVFLSDPATRQGIDGATKYDPIEDREMLALMCNEHPEAQLEVAVGPVAGVIALHVGTGKYAENGETTFKGLCEKHGTPETVSCAAAIGGRYYFFAYDDSLEFEEDTGLRLITGIEGLPVQPFAVDGDLEGERDAASSVQSILAWLRKAEKTAELPQSAEPESEDVQTEAVTTDEDAPAEETAVPPQMAMVDEDVVKEPAASTPPVDLLRNEITSWVSAGNDKNQILAMAIHWNRDNGASVKTEEIVNLVDEVGETDTVEVESLAGEDLLFKLAEDTVLFHDGLNHPFFHFEGAPFKAPSKDYEGLIQYRYYKKTGEMPKAKHLKNVMNVLRSKAKHEGPQIDLKNRVSDKDGAIIYDLNDKRYLKTTAKGWEIIPAYPLFYRQDHQKPQVEPVVGGDPWEVFDYLPPVAEENRLLILVYLISLFVPRIAHPVLAVFGDQGSAKSCFCSVINKLVDPTLTDKVILPKNERDLVQTLKQKYVTVLDNLSKIDNRVSDIFCQVVTGASISYRSLYTDEGENIAQFRHVIILNSISLAIANADLMDRSIILKCHRIKPEDRKPEDELWAAFEEARPGILGGIFDTLVKAMGIYPTLKIDKLPRLADFAKWGYAIAEALGQSGEKFIDDFSENIKRQNESVAEKNVLCQAVLQLMSDKDTYLKSVQDAHSALKNIAREDAKDATFPKLPQNMRDGLDKLRSTLLEHGITFEYMDRQAKGVQVLFSKISSSDTSPVEIVYGASKQPYGVPDVANVPDGEIPVVEFDEIPEVAYA